jgi:hypothetical protein
MKPRKKAKTLKRPVRKTVRRLPDKKRKVLKPKRKTMANPEQKTNDKADEKAPAVEQYGHKNLPVGPATTKPLADWRKDRDYENFNPTAEK